MRDERKIIKYTMCLLPVLLIIMYKVADLNTHNIISYMSMLITQTKHPTSI